MLDMQIGVHNETNTAKIFISVDCTDIIVVYIFS